METAVDSLVDLSNRMLGALQPRLARHPIAQTFADYSSAVLDHLPFDFMSDAIDDMNEILAR